MAGGKVHGLAALLAANTTHARRRLVRELPGTLGRGSRRYLLALRDASSFGASLPALNSKGLALEVLSSGGSEAEVLSKVLSKNEKGPPRGEPKSLILLVPAPGVEPGTY